ncbi:MAG: chromosome segregation protein SMC [Pseudomonadota bacterium]
MRLKHIKLAGFKSFVDPTTVSFPSNLCAVVGPNGCGKSNIIDAVRWVMGESSAKNLRGESMADVIFNGSNSRKPIGQASIELVFDNSDATLKGEYAGFSDIAIKRKVTRDGHNNYYLNGSKCRRRDIVDIFLGTGLGPRSYAIIEQGMISRLIEAKPEELRVYIEEAAGISKYKERRRDTENRMRRTQENLERLTDIREELDRQLARLERQSKAAEKYTELKQEERAVKAQLEALRYRILDQQAKLQQQAISEQELNIESFVTEQVSHDTAIEKYRTHYTEHADKLNEVQGRFYAVGSEIARLEQSIQHVQERNRQLQDDLSQVEHESEETRIHLASDTEKVTAWEVELAEIEPQLELLQFAENDSGTELLDAEEAMQAWQREWDEFNQQAAEPRQRAEVEQSRIQHIEQVQTRLIERIRRLEDENVTETIEGSDEIPLLQQALNEALLQKQEKQALIDTSVVDIEHIRESIVALDDALNDRRSQLQKARGRHASLEALQQAAASGGKNLDDWLHAQTLDAKPRILAQLTVEPQWQTAVELVLGDALQAVCVEDLEPFSDALSALEQGALMLLDKQHQRNQSVNNRASLANYVETSSDISALLAGVYTADSLNSALAMRSELAAHESVITADGLWLGPNWLRVKRVADDEDSVLERQQVLDSLNTSMAELEATVENQVSELRSQREQLAGLEQQREHNRRELDEHNKRFHQQQSQLNALQVRIEQDAKRRQKTASDIAEAREQLDLEADNLTQSRANLQQAISAMEQDAEQKEVLLNRRDSIRGRLDQSRQRARHDKDKLHALAMRHQSIKTQLQSIGETMKRLQDQSTRLQQRRQQLQTTLGDGHDPTEEYKLELEALLEKRIALEAELNETRRQVETVEQHLRDAEQRRSQVASELQTLRATLTETRLSAQTVQVKRETIEKQLLEDGNELQQLLQALDENATEEPLVSALEHIHQRITRLGPINLAAIDEYKVESERKTYLDRQNADLCEALTTLENAIIKIDRETRTRFKETFDQINSGIKELFPKVFGGGHAYLELTGQDLLDTGVAIMARPPGKRNSTIHLLSGGEKALTAIALVFSIFRLNPAPFCMLDEVDAPLDDANVARYTRLVEEMAEQIQFIYITHNKIAMEMAQQLMGVTMHEAGVSRMVTVDVNEAAELAAV